MKKLIKLFSILCLYVLSFSAIAQSSKTVDIYFYEQPHLFFKAAKSGDYSGVEADILKEFFKWCSEKKGITVSPKYHSYKTFDEFYKAIQSAPTGSIGAGTVTINEERKALFDYSAPYLKNVAVFVSQGNVATFTNYATALSQSNSTGSRGTTSASLNPDFSKQKLVGLIEKGSVHMNYMKNFVARYAPNMEIEEVAGNLAEVLASDPKYVAYMDVITYRELIKSSDKYFKIHRDLTMRGENFGFILPKNSEWTPLINEFMESGFGFTATRKYQNILESYLGYELITTVDML